MREIDRRLQEMFPGEPVDVELPVFLRQVSPLPEPKLGVYTREVQPKVPRVVTVDPRFARLMTERPPREQAVDDAKTWLYAAEHAPTAIVIGDAIRVVTQLLDTCSPSSSTSR